MVRASLVTCDGLTPRQRFRQAGNLAMLREAAARALAGASPNALRRNLAAMAFLDCGSLRDPFDGLAFIGDAAALHVFASWVEGCDGIHAGGRDQIGGAS